MLILCYNTTAHNGSLYVRYTHHLYTDHAKYVSLSPNGF